MFVIVGFPPYSSQINQVRRCSFVLARRTIQLSASIGFFCNRKPEGQTIISMEPYLAAMLPDALQRQNNPECRMCSGHQTAASLSNKFKMMFAPIRIVSAILLVFFSQELSSAGQKDLVPLNDLTPMNTHIVSSSGKTFGQDITQLVEKLLALSPRKDEFETTDRFQERIRRAQAELIVEDLSLADAFTFVLDPTDFTTSYDADKQMFDVILRQDSSSSVAGSYQSYLVREVSTHAGSYPAVNGYGAMVTVDSVNEQDYLISFPTDHTLATTSRHQRFGMSLESAKATKNALGVAAICHLRAPFLEDSEETLMPTFSEPMKLTIRRSSVQTTKPEFVIYNTTTGEVYSSFSAEHVSEDVRECDGVRIDGFCHSLPGARGHSR